MWKEREINGGGLGWKHITIYSVIKEKFTFLYGGSKPNQPLISFLFTKQKEQTQSKRQTKQQRNKINEMKFMK